MVVDGEPRTGGQLECFPSSLLEQTEPLAADARPLGDGRQNALLKVIAAIVGVSFDELKRRDVRRRRTYRVTATALAIISCIAVFRASVLYREERERERARQDLLERIPALPAELRHDPRGGLMQVLQTAGDAAKLFITPPGALRAGMLAAVDQAREVSRFTLPMEPLSPVPCEAPAVRIADDEGQRVILIARRFSPNFEEPRFRMIGAFGMDGSPRGYDGRVPTFDFDQLPASTTKQPTFAFARHARRLPRPDSDRPPAGEEDDERFIATYANGAVVFWERMEPYAVGSHEDTINSVAIREDGSLIATGSGRFCDIEVRDSIDSTVRLWTPNGRQVGTLRGHEVGVCSVAFSNDGRLLASIDEKFVVRLWDIADIPAPSHGEKHLSAYGGGCQDVAIDEKGELAASACWGTVVVYALASRKSFERAEYDTHLQSSPYMIRDPLGEGIFAGAPEAIELLPWARTDRTGPPLARVAPHDNQSRTLIAVSESGQRVAYAADAKINIIDRHGTVLGTHGPFEHEVKAMAFGDDQSLLVASGGAARVWTLGAPPQALEGSLHAWIAASSRASILISAEPGIVTWWYRNGPLISPKARIYVSSLVTAAAVSDRAQLTAIGFSDGTVSLFDLAGKSLAAVLLRQEDYIADLDFSADGTRLVSVSNDGTMQERVIGVHDLMRTLCSRLRVHPDAHQSGAEGAQRACAEHEPGGSTMSVRNLPEGAPRPP